MDPNGFQKHEFTDAVTAAKIGKVCLRLLRREIPDDQFDRVPGASINKLEPDDRWIEGRFVLKAEFKAGGYARLMNNRLLIFKPAIVNRRDWFPVTEQTRKNAIIIDSEQYSDVARVKLPSGFKVDEMPEPVTLQTSFGKYSTAYKVSDGQLTSERTLVLRSTTLPPEQYSAVRDFLRFSDGVTKSNPFKQLLSTFSL